jgi:hypothetical protein
MKALTNHPDTGKFSIFILSFLLMACLCLILGINRSSALEISAEASGGYDSNAVLSEEETGSGFARYRLRGTHPFFRSTKKLSGLASIEGNYQDFFNVSDNYGISAGADMRWHLKNARLIPILMGDVMVYRNRELPEDDVNAVLIGTGLKWLAASRLTLVGYQSFSWRDNAAAGTDSGMTGTKTGVAGGFALRGRSGRRGTDPSNMEIIDDEPGVLSKTRVESKWFIGPSLTVDFILGHNQMFSTEKWAEYSENGVIAAVHFDPDEKWAFSFTTAYWDSEYDLTGYQEDTVIADLSVSRYIDKWKIFGLARWLDKDASLSFDTYQQTVIECGVSRKF